MLKCRPNCAHRRMVHDYHAARHAEELSRELATNGYAAETREYRRLLTFRDWLVQLARPADREGVA